MTRFSCVPGLPPEAMGCGGRSLPAWWTALALVALAAGLGSYDAAATIDAGEALEIRRASYRATAWMGFPCTLLVHRVSQGLAGHGIETFAAGGAAGFLRGWVMLYACGLAQWVVAGWGLEGVLAWRRQQRKPAGLLPRGPVAIHRHSVDCGSADRPPDDLVRRVLEVPLSSVLPPRQRQPRGP